MKKLLTPSSLLPIIIGLTVGIILFILGDADDAPGLSAIGLIAAFGLIMWGIYNTGAVKKGFFTPIILFCLGAGGIIFSIALLLDGEFETTPQVGLIGMAIGIVLIIIGASRLRKVRLK